MNLFFKKKGALLATLFFALATPLFAAGKSNFLEKLTNLVLTPLLGLFSMGALVYFLYGIMVFFYDQDQNEESRTKLKRHMTWGLVGLFIIFSIGGIVSFVSSFGSK
jgi:hypothetical protein